MTSVRRALTYTGKVLVIALAFLAGGLALPKIVEATSSSGERSAFFPLAPARILDTRFGPSPLPVGTKVGAGQTIELQIDGQGGVPATASAVLLNVTVLNASTTSHLTIFPAGTAKPNSSSLNFGAGQVIPNSVTAKIGANGKVAIFNNAGTVDVIADVNGYYEDHNHDDRYDTKAQVDTKINNAQAEADYVGSSQIANGSIAFSDIANNSLTLTKFFQLADTKTGISISVQANSCKLINIAGVDFSLVDVQGMVRPELSGFASASTLIPIVTSVTAPQANNANATVTIQLCNPTGATISGTATVELKVLD